MSTLESRDLHNPLSQRNIEKLVGHVFTFNAFQAVAADANVAAARNGSPVVPQAGRIESISMITPVVAATGESMSVDIHKSTDGGATYATILTAPKVVSSTTAAKTVTSLDSLIDPAKNNVSAGDLLRAVLDYTAGGGPTPMVNTHVSIEIRPV